MPLQPDARVADRWLVRERLAVGGMGEVWRAEDVRSGADVAVKVLRPGVAAGERRFAAEIAALEVLRHPNIVRLIAAGVHPGPDGDAPYFVMDLVTGPSLAERLEDGPVEPAPARRVGSDVAAALAAAHAHDIVHRDVKPSNILLAADGRVRLADFGIARTLDMTSLTATGFAIGTASYVAPEQLSDARGVGPAADVYALGLVLFESLTGDRAFDGSPAEAAMARLHRDLLIPDDLPDPWPRLLTAMTARAPAHRPSAGAVVAILRAPAGSGQETRELLRLPSPPAGGVGPAAPAEVPTSAGAE
ncbi:MAG: serine/threonine protein kinase, partial [Nitriliruptoraceae bacterium]|nr:serine/threonine protein kinase [Nitriliruptoraceae bacterium]